MGGAPCLIIIMDGNLAYGVVDKFRDKHSNINTFKLESAIKASCESIAFAGIYYYLETDSHISIDYTQPIIDLHERIIQELGTPSVNLSEANTQNMVDQLAKQLIVATKKLQELFN